LQNNPHTPSLEDMRDIILKLVAQVAPITCNILRGTLSITSDFVWNDHIHETQKIRFAIQIQELPPQLFMRIISDRWIGAEKFLSVSLNHLVLPANYHQHTELLSSLHRSLKALVRERIDDWQARLTGPMKEKTTCRWDNISRSWQHKSYVQIVSLVIIDEIHLLGGDRGPILEDLADLLCIDEGGLFNFSHSVRPVPLDINIKGFSEKHYCPRMATMNKPTFINIMRHSPIKPVIVFVSLQTRSVI
ncbi:4096_t:CDS:2, partial [Funneliformis geosporum]